MLESPSLDTKYEDGLEGELGQEVLIETDEAFETAENLERQIDESELSPETKVKYKLSLAKIISRFMKGTVAAAMLGGAYMGIVVRGGVAEMEHAQKGDSVLVDIEKSGYKYRHNDAETTRLLNLLTEDCSRECSEVIWKMEQEVGAPKIRSIEQTPEYEAPVQNRAASYDPFTNTIYISISNVSRPPMDQLFSEYSHSLQASSEPTKNLIRSIVDYGRIKMIQESESIPLDKTQETLYDTPGTVEYEAHKIIEPSLKREFQNRLSQALLATKLNTKK